MHGRFTAFKNAVAAEADRRSWFRSTGAIPLVVAVVLFAVAGGALVFRRERLATRLSALLGRPAGRDRRVPRRNAALCLGTLVFNRRAWRRRTRAGQEEAERWEAFRRYLLGLPAPAGGAARDARAWSATSYTASRSGSPSACCRAPNSTCPRPSEASSIYWISSR